MLELSDITKPRDITLAVIYALPTDMKAHVLRDLQQPYTIGNLKKLLFSAEVKTPDQHNDQLVNMRWDSAKYTSLQAFYDKMFSVGKLALGIQNADKLTVQRFIRTHFKAALPSHVQNEMIFRMSDYDGSKLVNLAARIMEQRKPTIRAVNNYTASKPRSGELKGTQAAHGKHGSNRNGQPKAKPSYQCHYCNGANHRWRRCNRRRQDVESGKTKKDWQPAGVEKKPETRAK